MQTFRELDRHLGMIPSSTVTALSEVTAGRGREDAFRLQQPQILETLTEIARIQSTESSNAIEAITAPPQRIAELVRERPRRGTGPRKKSRDTEASSTRSIPAPRTFHFDDPSSNSSTGISTR